MSSLEVTVTEVMECVEVKESVIRYTAGSRMVTTRKASA